MLMIEQESRAEQAHEAEYHKAQSELQKHNEEEVAHLHEQADATRSGATWGAALTVAGGGLGLVSNLIPDNASQQNPSNTSQQKPDINWQQKTAAVAGQMTSNSASFARDLWGAAPAQDAQASATQSRQAADQAKLEAQHLYDKAEKANAKQDKAIDLMRECLRDEAEAKRAQATALVSGLWVTCGPRETERLTPSEARSKAIVL